MKARRSGFTLIELLVVVAIIAVLIAILLPSLGRARDQAKVARCASTLRSVYQGIQTYISEYDGALMPAKINNSLGGGAANSYWFGPQLLGAAWGKNSGLAFKDSNYAGNVTNKNVGGAMSMASLLYCPAIERPTKTSSDQDQNSYTYNRIFGDSANVAAFPFVKMSSFADAASRETLVMTEDHGGADKGTDDWYFGSKNGGSAPSFTYTKAVASLTDFPNPLNSNHGKTALAARPHAGDKKGNMLFLDGQILLDDVYKLKGSTTDMDWIVDPIHNQRNGAFPF
jgi:prepilin-type N-terminal cleavage/methylation domain-containing protein